jgi:BMFP domain-containing protein YqiC
MTDESIDQLARRLAESVPQGIQSLRKDLESNFRSVLKTGLGKLDLVTREEFEVQQAVLARTRELLSGLEARLQELEGQLAKPPVKKKRKTAKKKRQPGAAKKKA